MFTAATYLEGLRGGLGPYGGHSLHEQSHGESLLAVMLNRPESLRKWVRQAEADGRKQPAVLKTTEREELARLRYEVKDLRRANDILKAASVFFAGELDPRRSK